MIRLDIPGFGPLEIQRVVSDYTGTHAFGGRLTEPVRSRLVRLADLVEIHILTSDTFGTARAELAGLPVTLQFLSGTGHDEQKAAYVVTQDPRRVAAFGNGQNDRLRLKMVK
jgi:soluble P-type ATPase